MDKVVGIDARGFIFGAVLAYRLGVGFVPARKKEKLPYETLTAIYSLEYGEDSIEMHVDAIERNERVVVIDDLIATSGTMLAATPELSKTGLFDRINTQVQFPFFRQVQWTFLVLHHSALPSR